MNNSRDTSKIHDSIIETATRLFGKSGFHQTPMSELATQAGVSVGSIYRLFRDKDDLIVAVVRTDLERRLQAIKSILPNVGNGNITVNEGLSQFIKFMAYQDDDSILFDILAESSRNTLVANDAGHFHQGLCDFVRELALLANPDLLDHSFDEAQALVLGIASGPFWLGLRYLQSQANARFTQTAETILKILQTA